MIMIRSFRHMLKTMQCCHHCHVRGVTLGINVVPLHLNVNPETSTLDSHVWFVMRWQDTRLQWVASNYENISTVHIVPDKVWHPDIMVYNSVQHYDYEMTDLLVTSDGTVGVVMIPPDT